MFQIIVILGNRNNLNIIKEKTNENKKNKDTYVYS